MKKSLLIFIFALIAGSVLAAPVLVVSAAPLTCPENIPNGTPIGRGNTADCCVALGGATTTSSGREVCSMPENPVPKEKTITPTSGDSAAAPRTASPSGASNTGVRTGPTDEFKPLTTLPGIKEVTSSESLPTFFNNLYMIAVGLAGILAVIQIIRGGIQYMLEGANVMEKREAKHIIGMSILGLVLVLSPALVFGIINPDILKLGVDVSKIAPGDGGGGLTPGSPGNGEPGANNPETDIDGDGENTGTPLPTTKEECEAQGHVWRTAEDNPEERCYRKVGINVEEGETESDPTAMKSIQIRIDKDYVVGAVLRTAPNGWHSWAITRFSASPSTPNIKDEQLRCYCNNHAPIKQSLSEGSSQSILVACIAGPRSFPVQVPADTQEWPTNNYEDVTVSTNECGT